MEEKQQELMYKLSMFEQQMRQMQQQLQMIEQAIMDMQIIDSGLDDIIGGKDKEILAQIGKGIFVKTKLLSEELTVDIGERNFVKKSVPETKEMIKEQIKKLEDVKKELENNQEQMAKEFEMVMASGEGVEK